MTYFLIAVTIFFVHSQLTLAIFAWIYSIRGKNRQQPLRDFVRDLKGWQKIVAVIGVLLDVAYNYSPLGGSVALFAYPRRGEVLFTAHLMRIVRAKLPGYTYSAAKVYCAILNVFDKNHCREL